MRVEDTGAEPWSFAGAWCVFAVVAGPYKQQGRDTARAVAGGVCGVRSCERRKGKLNKLRKCEGPSKRD